MLTCLFKAYKFWAQFPAPLSPAELRSTYKGIKDSRESESPDDIIEEDIQVPMNDGSFTTCRVFRQRNPKSGKAPPAIIIHGGGYMAGDRFDEEWTCRIIVRELGAVALSIQYRLAPEHAFPQAFQDCWDACKWVSFAFKREPY